MKKLILSILFLIPLIVSGQVYLNNNTVQISQTGDLKYDFTHGVSSTDSLTYSVGGTQNVYYKLNPTGADTLKDHEADNLKFNGDSVLIEVAGDYTVCCWLNLSTSNANDKIRVKLYKNNVAYPINTIGRWIINSDGSGVSSETKYFMWYVTLAVGDVLSVRVANLTGDRAIVLRDWKLYIEKKPE